MSTERQFLNLIRADLDNPVPRLIFADWLDEQGDPRGELIRIQCELERPGLSAVKFRRLREREQELLEEYSADWLEPIASRKLKFADWTFRRGFVEKVAIDAREFIEKGDFLHPAFPLLHVLELKTVRPGLVDALAGCPALEQITELQLTSNFGRARERRADWQFKGNSPFQHFLSSPHFLNLQSITMADGGFQEEDLRGVLACANLKLTSFDLSNTPMSPRAIRLGLDLIQNMASATCLRDLRELSLRSNDLSINHVLILTYSHLLGNLESLDLRGNPLGSQSNMIALVGLERFTRLKHLNLQSCGVGDAGVNALLRTPLWGRLESLMLWNNHISDRGLMEIARAEAPAKLRALELRRNEIGDLGLEALAHSPVLSAVGELHLEYNRIEDAGLCELAASEYADGLRELHLRGNSGISDRGGIALASPGFPHLDVLDLAGTQIGDGTAFAIAETPASESLRVLDLGGTRITASGAQALAESEFLDSLEFLDLRMNHLRGDCVVALVERFGRRVLAY